MSTAMKHVLDGFSKSWGYVPLQPYNPQNVSIFSQFFQIMLFNPATRRTVSYVLSFVAIYIIAQTNPRKFVVIMEYITSLALNLESGILIAIMIGNSRTAKFQQLYIPFVLHPYVYALRYVVMFYFTFAVAYDLISIVLGLFW